MIVGILNVTPDSFSDGGRYFDSVDAIARGTQMVAEGADIIDVGGESTRPGAKRIEAEEECRRVLPVVAELARQGATVSIDTTRSAVARAAVEVGASLINDVSGGHDDAAMAATVAELQVPWILTHSRGPSEHMYVNANYVDLLAEVRRELVHRVDLAVAAGVRPDHLILDPGLGFAKQPDHDLLLLDRLESIVVLGFPVLVGASRKRFLDATLGGSVAAARRADERDGATLAATVLAARAGAWGVRVHDVAANLDAVRVVAAARRTSRSFRGTETSSGAGFES
jgi:dihydropteroate synthase